MTIMTPTADYFQAWNLAAHNESPLLKAGIEPRTNLDYMKLSCKKAEKLADVGSKARFETGVVALPEFHVEFFLFDEEDEVSDEFFDTFQSTIPYVAERDTVYAVDIDFYHTKNMVYAVLSVEESNDSSGGTINLATVSFWKGDRDECCIAPESVDLYGLDFMSPEDMFRISAWTAKLWNGIQWEMFNKPEVFHYKEKRDFQHAGDESETRTAPAKRTVAVQRVIMVYGEDYGPAPENREKRKYTTPAWTVTGHQRRLKSGKIVNVRGYTKGPERKNKQKSQQKEYRFVEDED